MYLVLASLNFASTAYNSTSDIVFKPIFKIGILENGNYLISYQKTSGFYTLKVVDINRTIIATKENFYCPYYGSCVLSFISYSWKKNTIMVSFHDNYNGYQHIQTLDENLKEITRQQAQQNNQYNVMSSSNSIVVCFALHGVICRQ
jgi:hypothetical protein